MSHCPNCHTENPETTRLWDGKEYCRTCLRQYSEELDDYARQHDSLRSTPEMLRETVKPGYYSWFNFKGPRGSLLMALTSMIGFFGCFFLLAQKDFHGHDFLLLIAALGAVVFLVLFCCYYPYWLFRFSHGGTEHRFRAMHPAIDVGGGMVLLTFGDYNQPSAHSRFTVPLNDVRLIRDSAKKDRLIQPSGMITGDVLLLDFSDVDFAACGIKPVFLWGTLNTWLKHPFLVCCNSKWSQPIWERFFELIKHQTDLRPVENGERTLS